MVDVYLGIDIGGTKSTVSLGSSDAKIIDTFSFATEEPLGPEQTVRKLIENSKTLIGKHDVNPVCIGISCGSPLDPEQGIIQSPPNLPSWKEVEIVRVFKEEFSIPVYLENDANAGALAEFSFGAGRGTRNMVFITFGTGCGSGIIINGRLHRGSNYYAGEVGHLRLEENGPVGYNKAGSFEGFCSGGGIAQLAEMMLADFKGKTILSVGMTAKNVGEAAEAGDGFAITVLQRSGHYLGRGLSYILDILNPELIVIGSIFVRCEEFLRPAMEEALKREALTQTVSACRIVPAGLGERVGDYAAFSVAYYAYGSL